MAEARLAAHKKGARNTGRSLAFLDETGHTFRSRVEPTWAPVGHPPVLRRMSKRREVSSLVALTAPSQDQPARLYARHFVGTVHAAEVIAALRYFRRKIGRPLVIIWDRLNAHRARVVQDYLAAHPEDFQVEWLPAYAPELNPDEQANSMVKREMANAQPISVEQLRREASRAFRRVQRRPELLERFFHHAGLSVT